MHCLRTSPYTSLLMTCGRCADVYRDVWSTTLTGPRVWVHSLELAASTTAFLDPPQCLSGQDCLFPSSRAWVQIRFNTDQEQFPQTICIQQPCFVALTCPDHATKRVLILFAELVHGDVAGIHLYKTYGFRSKVSTLKGRYVNVSLTSPYDSDFTAVIRLSEGKPGISTSGQHYF